MSTVNICRLCLGNPQVPLSILRENAVQMLESLTGIKVTPEDKVSTMCATCYLNLKKAHAIQQDMIKADQALKQRLSKECNEEVIIFSIRTDDDLYVSFDEDKLDSLEQFEIEVNEDEVQEQNLPEEIVVTETLVDNTQNSQEILLSNIEETNSNCAQEAIIRNSQHDHQYYSVLDEQTHDSVDKIQKSQSNRSAIYQCVFCADVICNDSLNKHMEEHYLQQQECDFCNEKFSNPEMYEIHKWANHLDELTVNICKECGIEFHNKMFYEGHLKKFHNVIKLAGKILEDSSLLQDLAVFRYNNDINGLIEAQKHFNIILKVKRNIKPKKPPQPPKKRPRPIIRTDRLYTCMICSKTFTNQYNYRSHVTFHKSTVCPICSKTIRGVSLRRHLEHHNGVPQICEICGATLKNKVCLRAHMSNNHRDIIYNCDQCGKSFKKRANFDYHYRIHHTHEPLDVCVHCGKKFYKSGDMTIHIRREHPELSPTEGPELKCPDCNRTFAYPSMLRVHKMKSCRFLDKQKVYNCEQCGIDFSSKVAFCCHKRKPHYSCEICQTEFTAVFKLNKHKRVVHNVINPESFVCHVCLKSFPSEFGLKCHMVKAHKEQ